MKRLVRPFSRRRIADCAVDRRATSAVEFSMIAPILILSLLSVFDLGAAFSTKLAAGHVVRAGAEGAMTGVGEAGIRDIMLASSRAPLNPQTVGPVIHVERYCTCPNADGVTVGCSFLCPGSNPTSVFYRLRATYEQKGILLPAMQLTSETRVRIR